MISYNGFNIDERTYTIYQGKRPIFTAWWQRCISVDDAKAMIDYSNQAKAEQLKKIDIGKSFKKFTTSCELENGNHESEQFQSWMEKHQENELMENQNH